MQLALSNLRFNLRGLNERQMLQRPKQIGNAELSSWICVPSCVITVVVYHVRNPVCTQQAALVRSVMVDKKDLRWPVSKSCIVNNKRK